MKTTQPSERLPKAVKAVATLVAALLVGALGNGVWEFFLKDILIAAGNGVLTLTSYIWSGYVDVLYREVGKLRADSLVMLPFSFFASVLILAPIFATQFLIRMLKRVSLEPKIEPSREPHFLSTLPRLRLFVFGFIVPVVVGVTLLNVVQLSESMYSRRAGVWADRCIDIVAPSISPQEHLLLRAQLRSVETAKQFYALHNRLLDLSRKANTPLPQFVPIGLPNAT